MIANEITLSSLGSIDRGTDRVLLMILTKVWPTPVINWKQQGNHKFKIRNHISFCILPEHELT